MKSTKIEKLFVVLALISSFLFVGLERSQAVTYCPEGYTISGTNCTITTTYSAGSAATSLTVQILVVAAGGGGGSWNGTNGNGGGGAGGVLEFANQVLTGSAYAVTIGSGGAGGTNSSNSYAGGNSQFGSLTTVIGGGRGANGGAFSNASSTGGSGGGGGGSNELSSYLGSTGTTSQGSAGGNGSNSGSAGGGGGGGAGAVGANGVTTTAGNGGVGITNSNINAMAINTSSGHLVSSNYYFAGGGGASTSHTSGVSSGGSGGGGAGAVEGGAGTSATANTGGGGGAGRNANGGSGASGIVIIQYTGSTSATGGTISTGSGFTFHKFTNSGTFTLDLPNGCNSGDSLSGSTCTHVVTIAGTTPGARCPAGSHDDPTDVTKCIKDGGSIAPAVAPISTPSCATGYILTAGSAGVYTCITGVASYTATTFTTYTCPTGGTLTGTLCIVSGTVNNQSYNATSQNNYTCPTGGTLTGTLCIIDKTLILIYPATLTTKTTYTCSNGGSLSGSTCTISNGNLLYTTPATTGTHWACPNGYWDSQMGNCTNGSSSTAFIYPVTYLCSYGGTLSGTTCYFYVDQQYSATGSTTSTYSCANSAELSGTNCLAYSVGSQYSANYVGTSYTCPQGGDLSGSVCIISTSTSSSQYNATSTPSLSCPKGGSLSGSVCGFTQSSISVTLTYTGSCLLYYTFNQSTQLCDPVSYPYINNIAPVLVGVYLCYTYSDGNLLYSNYYGYDASSPGITFSRVCSLQSNVEGSVNDEAGYYYCEILDRTTQEITSIVLATDITGFKENRSTTCTFTTSTDDDTTGEELNPLMESALDVCNIVNLISQSFANYITCQIDLNK